MAELADAADSKSADLRVLGVRLPLPAPINAMVCKVRHLPGAFFYAQTMTKLRIRISEMTATPFVWCVSPAFDATGRDVLGLRPALVPSFNPRAPRGARQGMETPRRYDSPVSIHAPRAGRDGMLDGFVRAA